MPEIHYKAFLASLKENKDKGAAPVYLIYGEELLYRTALEALVDFLIPESSRSLNYDPIKDTDANIFEAIERINTFSLLSGTKLIALCDSLIFATKQDETKLLEKSKAASDENDLPKAAKIDRKTTFRSITVDGENIEFSDGFTDLHTLVYKDILAGKGFGIETARPSINFVHKIREARKVENKDAYHPLLVGGL